MYLRISASNLRSHLDFYNHKIAVEAEVLSYREFLLLKIDHLPIHLRKQVFLIDNISNPDLTFCYSSISLHIFLHQNREKYRSRDAFLYVFAPDISFLVDTSQLLSRNLI
jgi:hypothetical protein